MKNTFGITKNNITNKIVDAYQNKDTKSIKKILSLIKENKEFSEMYVLYDDIENKFFENKETAKYFVEELSKKMNGKEKDFYEICESINKTIKGKKTENPEIYKCLDTLLENDNLLNIEKKINSKITLVNYLTSKKNIEESTIESHTQNEKLLMTLLSNDFNSYYGKTLSEEERKKLKSILNLNKTELENKIKEIRESIHTKIEKILSENYDEEIKLKLEKVKEQLIDITPTKHTYFKLMELKNGLD